MGQKLNVYLSDAAIEVLDDLVTQRKELWSASSNRSNTLSDLLLQQGQVYVKSLELVREAIIKYSSTPPGAERKPINIEEYEQFDTPKGYAEKLGVADE